MARKGGCNYEFESAKTAQGTKRITPSTFSRNNLSKGGLNQHANGSDVWGKSPKVSKGKAHDGRP